MNCSSFQGRILVFFCTISSTLATLYLVLAVVDFQVQASFFKQLATHRNFTLFDPIAHVIIRFIGFIAFSFEDIV